MPYRIIEKTDKVIVRVLKNKFETHAAKLSHREPTISSILRRLPAHLGTAAKVISYKMTLSLPGSGKPP